MNSREGKFQSRFCLWIAFKDSEGLVGPEDLPAGNFPPEAACVTKFLGFGQISFASPDSFFRHSTFRDIRYRADNFFVACLVSKAVCKIMKMLYRTIRHQQAMLPVKVISTLRCTFKNLCEAAHIVRMGSLQYQIGCRFCPGRVPVNPGRFIGPEYPLC